MAFTVSEEKIIAQLADMVKAEFVTHYAYKVYAQTLRDLSHDSIADHFEEHAADEMDHADFLLRRLAVLNGDAPVAPADAPPAQSDPASIIAHMIELEAAGIEKWRALVDMAGDDPMYVVAEEYMAKELEHSDDLTQLLPASNFVDPDSVPQVPGVGDGFLLSSIAARVMKARDRVSVVEKTPDKEEWCVKSESNPNWSGGCYDSKKKADDRLDDVEMFKHMKK